MEIPSHYRSVRNVVGGAGVERTKYVFFFVLDDDHISLLNENIHDGDICRINLPLTRNELIRFTRRQLVSCSCRPRDENVTLLVDRGAL